MCHLIIAHADHVSIFRWEDFYELARAAGVDLWLVMEDDSRCKSVPTLVTTSLQWTERASFLKALPLAACPRAQPYRPVAMPLPDDDFLTFRSSRRSLLSADRFAQVDGYRRAYSRTAAEEWPTDGDEVESFKTAEIYLERLTADAHSLGECLVRLRATQAALFAVGILVRLSPTAGPEPSPLKATSPRRLA